MAGPFSLTAANATGGVQPKGHHVGVHVVEADISLDQLTAAMLASITGQVVHVAKIGVGTRILAIQRNFAASAAGAQGALNIGLGTSLSCFGSASAKSGIAFCTKGFPKDVTASDDAVPRWRYVNLYVPGAASLSGGGTIKLQIFLTNDLT